MSRSADESKKRTAKRSRSKALIAKQSASEILENMSYAFVMLDRDCRYTYVNGAAERMSRRRREEMRGRTFWEVFPEHSAELTNACRRAIDEGATVYVDEYYAEDDKWFEYSVHPSGEGVNMYIREITARKRAESLLRKGNERVETILDSITDRFFVLDKEWRLTDFNKHAEEQLRALGKDPAHFIGTVLWEEFPHAPIEEPFRRAMSERVAITHEHYYPPLGEWVENRIFPSPDGGLTIFQRYITERKRAEAALRQSDERYHLLVDGIKEYAIFMLDTEGHVTTWNQGAERMKGYRAEEIIGEHFSRFYSAEDVEGGKPELHLKMAKEKGQFEDEGWRIRKDGTRFFADVVLTALTDEAGHLRGYTKVTHDITERKRAQEELRRSEAYLTEGQRLSHAGSGVWNVSTGEVFWSEETYRIYGFEPGTVKPSYEVFFNLVYPDERPSLEQAFDRTVQERRDYDLEFRIIRPDGAIRHIHSIGRPIFNESGDLIELVGTVMDVTARKRAEEDLHAAHAELAHMARVTTMGELAASIAHEVNQPLTAVITNGNACVRWLDRDIPNLEEAYQALARIIKEANRASEVINRIRAFVKLSTPEKTRVDVNALIRDTIALVGGEFIRNHVLLQTDLAPDISPALGDRIQLQQVILNILMNAIEASSAESDGSREILLTSRQQGSAQIVVAIRDSGASIDAAILEHVFDPFFTTKSGGMGMGLSISRSLVEAHGGRLWAIPNQGGGATFQFSLPV